MKRIATLILFFIIFIPLSSSSDALMLGDYDAEPRMDGRVNNNLLIDSLKEASINTYAYLIWHNKEYDWEDFNSFLPLAQENNIDTYVYLVPPSEDCEEVLPYRCDFVQWGEEIARLSLTYPTLKGFIIDDFIAARNDIYLTREYTREFIVASKEINSDIKFFPIIYYQDIIDYSRDYKDLTDGMIFPYVGLNPERNLRNTNDEIDQIRKIDEILKYNDKLILFTYPWDEPSNEGDYVSLSKTIQVPEDIENLNEVLLSFTISDDFRNSVEGYHYIQLLVDDELVWEEDVSGRENVPHISLNLKDYLMGKEEATISFKAIEKKAVHNFGVKISIINLEGIINSYDFVEETNSEWSVDVINLLDHNEAHEVIVMIYASKISNLDDIPSTEYVIDATQIAIDSYEEGISSGVMMYGVRKDNNNQIYNSIKELYGSYTIENLVNPYLETPPETTGGGSGGGSSKKSINVDTSLNEEEPLTYPSCKTIEDCKEGEICKAKRGNYFYKQCQLSEDENIERNSKELDSFALKLKNKIMEWFFQLLNKFNFQKT